MNSQLFEQMSSLAYSDFSKNNSQKEGFTFFNTDSNQNLSLNDGNVALYTNLRNKLSNDPKYDFNGNILLFNDEKLLISEQIKKDNEMLVTSENNLMIASSIAGVTMLIVSGIILANK